MKYVYKRKYRSKTRKVLAEQKPSDKFITGFNKKYANNVLGILNWKDEHDILFNFLTDKYPEFVSKDLKARYGLHKFIEDRLCYQYLVCWRIENHIRTCFIIYWNGDDYAIFIPQSGNTINPETGKVCTLSYIANNLGIDLKQASNIVENCEYEIDYSKCIADFKSGFNFKY